MTGRLKHASVVLVVAFATAQFVRPSHTNPPTDPSRTIQAHAGSGGLATVVDRSCRDCHSNGTVWPRYAHIAPLSWLMASAVAKGRAAVNFSEWSAYSPDEQRRLLSASCDDVSSGKMPGVYTIVRPDTKLSASDVETICIAAHQAEGSSRSVRGKP